MAENDIYEPEAIEALAAAKEYSAHKFVDAFLKASARTPEVATDRETLLSWFAVAVENGFARGWKAREVSGHGV